MFRYVEIFDLARELIPVLRQLHESGVRIRPTGVWDETYDDWLRRTISGMIKEKADKEGRGQAVNEAWLLDPQGNKETQAKLNQLAWARQALLDGLCPACGEELPLTEPSCHGFAGIKIDGVGGLIQEVVASPENSGTVSPSTVGGNLASSA